MEGIGGRTASQVLQAHGEGQSAARRAERVLEADQQDDQPARKIVMQKVVIINLNGRAYQLEEGAYDSLRAYLGRAEGALAKNRSEERRVGKECRARWSPNH